MLVSHRQQVDLLLLLLGALDLVLLLSLMEPAHGWVDAAAKTGLGAVLDFLLAPVDVVPYCLPVPCL